MRLFIALTINEQIKEEIYRYEESLMSKAKANVKWVGKDNLHITLKFLGEVKENKLEETKNSLMSVMLGQPSFEIEYKGVGFFPQGKPPRVIWVGAESPETIKLAKKIDERMSLLGFEKEEREFQNHITIGRVKEGYFDIDLIKKDIDKYFGRMTINKIDLYQSHLSSYGPAYEIIETFLA